TWRIDGKSPPVQTVYWWRTKGCRHLDGRKRSARLEGRRATRLETKSLPNLEDRGPWEPWSLEDHVLRIRASLLASVDFSCNAFSRSNQQRRRRPIESFDGVFHEQPERRITIPRARKEGLLKGVVSYTQLYSYIRA